MFGQKNPSASGQHLSKAEYLQQLQDLGFKDDIAEKVLTECNQHFDKAVDKLLQMGTRTLRSLAPDTSLGEAARKEIKETANPEYVKQLTEMGFDRSEVAAVLLATNNDVEAALNLLFSGGYSSASPVPKRHASTESGEKELHSSSGGDGKGKVLDMDALLAEELQRQEEEFRAQGKLSEDRAVPSVLSNTNTNFFIGMIAYMRYCLLSVKR